MRGAGDSTALALLAASVVMACSDERPFSAPEAFGSPSGAGGVSAAGPPMNIGGTAPVGGTANAGGAGASNVVPGGGASAGGDDGGEAGDGNGVGGGGGQPSLPRHAAYPPSPYPPENPDSDAKAMLGKILFWDEQLGGDGTVACGTCHRPSAGGSDPRSSTPAAAQLGPDKLAGTLDDVHGSLGVIRCNEQGQRTGDVVQVTTRKAPTYLDSMFADRLFWDGRAECAKPGCPTSSAFEDPDHPGTFPIRRGAALENQALGPPLSPVEMACDDATWPAIHARLANARPLRLAKQLPPAMADFITTHDDSYPKLFAAAFGNEHTSGPPDEINTRRIAFAIATHERRLRSDQTPWDRWNAGDDDALTPAQRRGLEVFMKQGACEGCHRVPFFTDGAFHFIGFHVPEWDLGRKAVNPEYGIAGALRTPTLRNVGLREAGGLLHNGAGPGASLAATIDLYDRGGLIDDERVTSVPIDAAVVPLSLTSQQKADLLDFLKHGLDDPRVKAELPPFDRPLLSTE